jgi:tetratricopeptide (TPR) repeat protein
VEGSGQKIGDRILLNIQLIEASTDRHLWANQYRREANDIFALQQEIAKKIAEEIQVIITPEEEKKIEKIPTDNVVAYDFFLKGKDLFYRSTRQDLEAAIPYFKNAIELDNEFALAYATAVMVYYYLDVFYVEKKYSGEIADYADMAMKFDPKSGESLIAKGLSHANKKEYAMAAPYFEKALEYNPGDGLVIHFLTEFYHMHLPNTRKYVEYALQGARLENPTLDSTTASFKYFHLANALTMAGFQEEGLLYVNKSLAFNPKGPFAGSLKGFIEFVGNKDLKHARERLMTEYVKDTTRFDLIHRMGKLNYLLRDYKNAYRYYDRFLKMKDAMRLDVYKEKNLEIGLVYAKMGFKEKSEELVESFKALADNDQTIYKHLHLSLYYCYRGDTKKAIEELKLFSEEDNYVILVILAEMDPLLDPIRDAPEFKKIMGDLKKKFWDTNKAIKEEMLDKGMP